MNAQPDAAKTLLIYPPITDPTSPYHSLTYLDSYARSRGYPAADIVDVALDLLIRRGAIRRAAA